jgi:Putative beta-barrel porin-2, OmpL-like. bbp2
MTVGFQYRPRPWLWLRPEVRGDWAGATHPYNQGRSASQLTFGFDTILLF